MVEDVRYLSDNETTALKEIKRRVGVLLPIRQYILFGSKARGNAAPDSDIDLLIITGRELKHRERHVISDVLFEVNLEYDTSFSFISVDEEQWNSKLYSFLPIHVNVQREGIPV
ncbi:MAG: nucleotidyltransferase domain-containing protein [Chitinivibrionales bacterium]|nr:nucleotidyltransferase domain-containing protein [Chitinivibrionales bacterium]